MLISFAAYTLLILNVFLFLKGKKNVYVTIATLFVIVILFMGMSIAEGDHELYKIEFETSREGIEDDILFKQFIVLSKLLGLNDYGLFLGLLCVVEMLLIFGGMKCLTSNPHAMLAVSIAYIIPMMAVAIRFSLGLAVMVFATKYLIKNKWLHYFVSLIVAILFHSGLILFVFYLFTLHVKKPSIPSMRKKMQSQITMAMIMLIFTAILYVMGSSSFFVFILSFIPSSELFLPRASTYLESMSKNGPLLGILIYLILYMYLKIIYRIICKQFDSCKIDYIMFRKVYCILSSIAISSIFVPFMFAGMIFIRYLMLPTILLTFYLGGLSDNNIINSTLKSKWNTPLKIMLFISWLLPAIFEIFAISLDILIKSSQLYYGL